MKLRKNTKHLSPEYFEVYEEISDKLNSSTMSTLERKEIMSDILDLLILAGKDNRQVSEVVGSDTDEFINQIQSSFGYRSSIIFNLITGIQYSIIYLFMIQTFIYIENIGKSFYIMQLEISMIFLLSLMAFIGVPFLFYFKRKNKLLLMLTIPVALLILFIALMETISKYFYDVPFLYNLAEGEINAFPNIWFVLLWSLIFIGSIILKWILRRASIKRL